MEKITVIGAGSWGTALAVSLAAGGHTVFLTARNPEHIRKMKSERENKKYLPGVRLPGGVNPEESYDIAIEGSSIVIFAVPSQNFRSALEDAAPFLTSGTVLVNVAKGIERGTLLRMSQIAGILRRDLPYVVLSGPSHAEEVGRLLPAALVAASDNADAAEDVQKLFMNDRLRVYTGQDVCGVELGGALKNIIALGAGISDGIGFGDNAKAALMTRGMAEISRLGEALGARPETFAGLTGMGDLIVTCTSMHSRNRRFGILLGEGIPPEKALARIGMVVEGYYTVDAAVKLAADNNVEMPISESIYRCLEGELTPGEAVNRLMGRPRKDEGKV